MSSRRSEWWTDRVAVANLQLQVVLVLVLAGLLVRHLTGHHVWVTGWGVLALIEGTMLLITNAQVWHYRKQARMWQREAAMRASSSGSRSS